MKHDWLDRPEGGNSWLRWIGLALAGFAGRTLTRLVAYPVTLYFLIRRKPEREASRQWLRRVAPEGPGRDVSLLRVARHFMTFARVTIDRFYLLSERFRRFDIRCHGLADLDRALESGRGVLMLSAHLGSFDALRVLALERPDVRIRIVLDVAQNPGVSAQLNALNPAMAATIIDARQGGPTVALAMKEALDQNAIVAMLADRLRPGNSMVTVDFCGAPAPLPLAPWVLAASLRVPVVLAFGLYHGGTRYDLHFERYEFEVSRERALRDPSLRRAAQGFANRLEHYARLMPDNWFNFYDFWLPR